MDVKGIGLFRMIAQELHWLGQRQDVLARNVANSDTPGFQGSDLKPLDFDSTLKQVEQVSLASTNPGHLAGKPAAPAAAETRPVPGWETSPDGNSVVLEQQMMELADTQARYQMATEIYRKQIGMLKTAIGSKTS
jgi:flagellar basal-body rod protein FlgB